MAYVKLQTIQSNAPSTTLPTWIASEFVTSFGMIRDNAGHALTRVTLVGGASFDTHQDLDEVLALFRAAQLGIAAPTEP
jgi:hypothetical protein